MGYTVFIIILAAWWLLPPISTATAVLILIWLAIRDLNKGAKK